MSWVDTVTDNAIKAGVAIGICDTAEVRKLKEQNEQSKLKAEMEAREDDTIKNHAKVMKEMDELKPSYDAVMLYATIKTGNMNALLEFLKPKETAKNPTVTGSKFERVRTEKPKPAEAPKADVANDDE